MGSQQQPTGVQVIGQALQVMFSQPLLAVMMFLQYAIWGSWAVALSGYLLKHLEFTPAQLAWIYAAMPLANLVVPFTGGQIADRWLPTQIALAIFHLAGAVFLAWMGFQKEFLPMMVLMGAYCLVFAPTLALTNSLAFRNLKDPERDFGPIRMWGTIGWIVANLMLSAMRKWFGTETPDYIDLFFLAAFFSFLQGVISLFLPHTPPAREAPDPLAFRRALVLLKDRNYLIFFIIAFVVATELQLYYILTNPFLQEIGPAVGITSETAPGWQTVAQIAEIFVIAFLLPYALPNWGIRNTMLVGILAWPIRYFVFSLSWYTYQAAPAMVWVTIASLALHGFCYVFFFVVAFIYTDMVAPRDIRASAQALINVAVLGIGLFVGTQFAGWLQGLFTDGGETNYGPVFLVPAIITLVAAAAFVTLFREQRSASVRQ
ncbi:MAG: MFS transporter [Armatimonadetes bacterium]|nr:MFS transporter [Armatimonadota bacterium]MDW8123015.1 MFS transporter [Armatimonadota bacterium]